MKKNRGAEHEHAAVPEVLFGIHIGACRIVAGLLTELADHEGSAVWRSIDTLPPADVTVTGFRSVSDDPESNYMAFGCEFPSHPHGRRKKGVIPDQMVRRKYQ